MMSILMPAYHKRIWHISVGVKFDMDLCQRCQWCWFRHCSFPSRCPSSNSFAFRGADEDNQAKATSSPSHWCRSRRHWVTMSMTRPLNGSSLYSHYELHDGCKWNGVMEQTQSWSIRSFLVEPLGLFYGVIRTPFFSDYSLCLLTDGMWVMQGDCRVCVLLCIEWICLHNMAISRISSFSSIFLRVSCSEGSLMPNPVFCLCWRL